MTKATCDDPAGGPLGAHPRWCDVQRCTSLHHPGALVVHENQIGVDLELSADLAYAVYLQQVEGAPAEINLMRKDRLATTLTRLTPLEAGILRDALTEALTELAAQVGR